MAKYYYNGVLLPEIPSEHLSTNPYVFIRKNNTNNCYELILCSGLLYYNNGICYNDASTAIQYKYTISLDDSASAIEWIFKETVSNIYFGLDANRILLWSGSPIRQSSASSATLYYPKCGIHPYTTEKINYNGVLLPAIPTEHFAANPFAIIRKNNTSGYYDLVLDTKQWYFNTNAYPTASTTQYWYRIPIVNYTDYSAWEFYKESTGYYTLDANRTLFWTLQDVSNGKNSINLYLSCILSVAYASVEDAVAAGVNNAAQMRMNIKQDDGVDTIAGADWFTYGGAVCNNVFVSGNSFFGFGSNAEHLKVNRQDAAMYNLWREEGTIGTARFLRIRWSGYTAHNSTSTSALLTYDVLLFDTGDICLYVVDVPTSNYSGTFSLGSLSYAKPTTVNRYVSFILQSDGTFSLQYAPIDFYIKRYLVRNAGTLYTVTDGALSELTGELNAALFQASGTENPPDGALLLPLSAPEVLCWTDSPNVPKITATVQGVPVGEHTITSDNIDIGHESIYGMTSVVATASEGTKFLLSFDGGAWMAYTDGSWSASDAGMTATELAAIPANAWSSVINSAEYMQLKATLSGVETVTSVIFTFDNETPLTPASEESEG